MEVKQYHDIAGFDQADNWWYEARRAYLDRLCSRYVQGKQDVALDVGCGTGANVDILKERAQKVVGLDPSEAALMHAKEKGYAECLLTGVEHMPLPDASIDMILCADVLEHVDDRAAIVELRRILKPGGTVVANVPAFMSLWHGNDDYSQHVRRYARRELVALFADHGFEVQHVRFWNMLFFVPVWIAARFYHKDTAASHANNLAGIPAWLNPLLRVWMRIETVLTDIMPLPFGVSLVLVARRN